MDKPTKPDDLPSKLTALNTWLPALAVTGLLVLLRSRWDNMLLPLLAWSASTGFMLGLWTQRGIERKWKRPKPQTVNSELDPASAVR